MSTYNKNLLKVILSVIFNFIILIVFFSIDIINYDRLYEISLDLIDKIFTSTTIIAGFTLSSLSIFFASLSHDSVKILLKNNYLNNFRYIAYILIVITIINLFITFTLTIITFQDSLFIQIIKLSIIFLYFQLFYFSWLIKIAFNIIYFIKISL